MTDYGLLTEKAEAATKSFHDGNDCRKKVDSGLKEITELQKHIGAYSKSLEVYKQYLSLPPKKREGYFEEYRADITLHRAAKKYFDGLGLKKLPTISALKKEYAALAAEQKRLNAGYKDTRNEMVALLMAKQNVDRILFGAPQKVRSIERDAR